MDRLLTWPAVLETLLEGEDLAIRQAEWAMSEVVAGSATEAQIAGFLIALRAKGVVAEELVGFRDAILEAAVPLPGDTRVVDIVGTGGDRQHTVNISTTASIVVAATGVPVLKHGNRAVSSSSGASDVLDALGLVPADDDPAVVRRILEEAGISFAWATRFHPGFRHAGPVRAQLGVPTVFNHNADVLQRTLAGETGAVRDIVLLNAAAALVAWRLESDPRQKDRPLKERLAEELTTATAAIDSGAATRTLDAWRRAAG